MEDFLVAGGHRLTCSRLDLKQPLPDLDGFDWLIVMGGPMGVYDEDQYPWLKEEKDFIRRAVEDGKVVLGICLGAQLIAEVMGARVEKNAHREIGWFPIEPSLEISGTILNGLFSPGFEVFHWHGDTFGIPGGAVPLASSSACRNQGFILGNRVIGLQFHLETTSSSAAELIMNCRDELDGSEYVQPELEILSNPDRFDRINRVMCSLLQRLEEKNPCRQ